MTAMHRLSAYTRYFFSAKRNGHGVHSPFVYAFAREVMPYRETAGEPAAEQWRKKCLSDTRTIEVTDFGTGASGPRRISDIARKAAKPPEQGQLLARIVARFAPEQMLELGTSLGITTIYQSAAAPHRQFVSMEGCPQTAALAREALEACGQQVDLVTGNFDTELEKTLARFPRLDYVYFDGNHRREPTLRYFSLCLEKAHNDSVFVFDDIHWSPEMEEAWREICAHPRVTATIDLFHFGLVFFRREQGREHFILK